MAAEQKNNKQAATILLKLAAAIFVCMACMFIHTIQAQATLFYTDEDGNIQTNEGGEYEYDDEGNIAGFVGGITFNYGVPTTVTVSGTKYTQITVTSSMIKKNTYYTYLATQDALNYAAEYATSSKPILVKVEAGSYELTQGLRIFSNTYLNMEGVTLTLTAGKEDNMIKIGYGNTDSATGYYYKNITINGGTWNENGQSHTLISLVHAQNVTVQNATFKNTVDGHLMEAAGVNGLTIYNCTFKDQVISDEAIKDDSKDKIYEAIQLDIIVSDHMEGYDDEELSMKDVVITGCTFSNVPRGVGSHTGILNNPIDGLDINNNTFTNIGDCAIRIMDAKNVSISDNTIKSSARGIYIYSYNKSGTYKASDFSTTKSTTTTSSKYKTPTDYNISISGNSITVYGGDTYDNDTVEAAIYIAGVTVSSGDTNASGDSLPAGNYYITGVEILDNKIVTYAHGVKLYDARNVDVCYNSITYKGTTYSKSTDTKYYTIAASEDSRNISIYNNATSKSYSSAYITGCSSGINIQNNTFKTASAYGIAVSASTVTSIYDNTVTSSGSNGIYVASSAKVSYIDENTVKSAGSNGIAVSASTVTYIQKNTITSPKKYGIYALSGATISYITSNKITGLVSTSYGIKNSSSTIKSTSGNTIKAA